jgi:hypothetical protein
LDDLYAKAKSLAQEFQRQKSSANELQTLLATIAKNDETIN